METNLEMLIRKSKNASIANRGMYSAVPKTESVVRANGNNLEDEPYIEPEDRPHIVPSSVTLYNSSSLKSIALETKNLPDGATITWSSEDTKIATVSTTGLVTFKKAGETTIIATYAETKKVKCKVTCSSDIAVVGDKPAKTVAIAKKLYDAYKLPIIPFTNFSLTLSNPTDKVDIKNENNVIVTVKPCSNTSKAIYAVEKETKDGVDTYTIKNVGTPCMSFTNKSGVVSYRGPADTVFSSAGSVKILNDFVAEKTLYFDCGVLGGDFTIDLNGHTITANDNTAKGHSSMSLAVLDAYRANISLIGEGSIITESTKYHGIAISGGKTCTIENARIKGSVTAVYAQKGTVTINNGYYEVIPYEAVDDKYKYTLNCLDANYKAGTAKINVLGGEFYKFDPSNNEAEGPSTNFVVEGKTVTYDSSTETYKVS